MKPLVLLTAVLVATAFPVAASSAQVPAELEERLAEVRERLALTDEQAEAARPIFEAHLEAQRQVLEGASANSGEGASRLDREAVARIREQLERNSALLQEKLGAVLTPEQLAELRKIEAERKERGAEQLLAFRARSTGEQLGLDEAGIERITPILVDYYEEQLAILERHGMLPGSEQGGRRRRRGRLRQLRALRSDIDQNTERVLQRLRGSGALTDAQLDAFKKLQEEQREQVRERLR